MMLLPYYLTINQSENCTRANHMLRDVYPHLAFRTALLKPYEEFGVFLGRRHPFPLHGPAIIPKLHFGLFKLTVPWAHSLSLGNTKRRDRIKQPLGFSVELLIHTLPEAK